MLHALLPWFGLFLMFNAIFSINHREQPVLGWGLYNIGLILCDWSWMGLDKFTPLEMILTPFATGWALLYPEHWKWLIRMKATKRFIATMIVVVGIYAVPTIGMPLLKNHLSVMAIIGVAVAEIGFRAAWYVIAFLDDDDRKNLRSKIKIALEKLKWIPPETMLEPTKA